MFKNNKFGKKDNNKGQYYEDTEYLTKRPGRPPVDDGSNYDTMLDVKAMSKLPNSGYSMKVDPYTESTNPATPYHLLNSFNKVIGASYAGKDNLDGGNVIQYNASLDSKFLEVFDAALLSLGLNYRYLPILAGDTNRGGQMIDEMRKAISEIVSNLNATTFKDQNIFDYCVETDLPMGSAEFEVYEETVIDEHGEEFIVEHKVYFDLADVIYAMCLQYQLVLQDIIAVFNLFNANRTKMGTMIRMSWNREVPILNSYFGLLKKKSFLAMFDSLALNLQGEYIDTDWMKQVNTINVISSRRSNSISDPLLEVIGKHNHPGIFRTFLKVAFEASETVYPGADKAIFDRDLMQYTIPGQVTATHFNEAIMELGKLLSLTDTLKWARQYQDISITDNDRFNAIKNYLDVIIASFTYFKIRFTDLRTVLTIMARVGVVNWTIGFKVNVVKETDCEISNYLVVNQLYKEVFGGAAHIRWNDVTKRWRTFSLWNLYYGTPEYAEKAGGAFISFSVKERQYPVGTAPDNLGYLPIAFTIRNITVDGVSGAAMVVNRQGTTCVLSRANSVQMSNTWQFARLVPLTSQSDLSLNVPTAGVTEPSSAAAKSHLYRFMLQVCDAAYVDGDYGIDADNLAVYEYEIEDFTNEVITYCRGNGPFRVSAGVDTSLGFFGLLRGRK